MDDAELAIICLNSSAGTAKFIVDELRGWGIKAGLLKIRMFRPFPKQLVADALKKLKAFAVLDRSESFSLQGGPLFTEIRSALYELNEKPKSINYIYGLGGRELTLDHLRQVFEELGKVVELNEFEIVRFLGVRDG